MRRAAVIATITLVAFAAAGASADTASQQPLPWTSPPFLGFIANSATTDPSGNVYGLATGPSSTTYVAAFNPQSHAPVASVGGGTGFVQITLPTGAHAETDFLQGSQLFVAGSVSAGAFIEGYNLADGTSIGPTIINKPSGTSFTAAGGTWAPGASGSTNVVVAGADTISHTPMLFTVNVSGGVVGSSPLCPSAFNLLPAGGATFAASAAAVNGSGQIMLSGVDISGLSQLPAVGSVSGGCSGLTVTPLAQPAGGSSDGFADAISALPGGDFVVGSDLSTATGGAVQLNVVLPTGGGAPGFAPFQGPGVASAHVGNVFSLKTGGYGLVGAQRAASTPTAGVMYRFDASGHLVSGSPTPFTDTHGADVVPQTAVPAGSGVSVLGIGSPTSGPNTLDIWSLPFSTSGGGGGGGSTPPCSPVTLTIQKETSVGRRWSDHNGVFTSFGTPSRNVSAESGSEVEYVVEAHNEGDCDASNLEISDFLPRGFEYLPDDSQLIIGEDGPDGFQIVEEAKPPRVLNLGTLNVSIPSLKAHHSVEVFIRGHVTGNAQLRNVATVGESGGHSQASKPAFVTVTPATQVTSATANAISASGTASRGAHAADIAADARAAGRARTGLARVDVAVEKSGKHQTCLWLTSAGAFKTTKGGCATIQWLRATGTTRWHYRFKHRLPKGKYLLFVRPVSRNGVAKSTFARSLHDLVAFSVR